MGRGALVQLAALERASLQTANAKGCGQPNSRDLGLHHRLDQGAVSAKYERQADHTL